MHAQQQNAAAGISRRGPCGPPQQKTATWGRGARQQRQSCRRSWRGCASPGQLGPLRLRRPGVERNWNLRKVVGPNGARGVDQHPALELLQTPVGLGPTCRFAWSQTGMTLRRPEDASGAPTAWQPAGPRPPSASQARRLCSRQPTRQEGQGTPPRHSP